MEKKQDVLALLDKAVGKKGPLRIPAYWMREVLLKIMDWAEGLTPKVDVPTKISQLENDVELATQSYVNATVDYSSSNLRNEISSLEMQTKRIGTSQSITSDSSLLIFLSGQPASLVRQNMFPNNQTVHIGNATFDGTSYRLIAVAKNITFSCSDSYTIVNSHFEHDDYCVCEFSFNI
jgi:hypothetical protein